MSEKNNTENNTEKKKKYEKPVVVTEDLTSFGAVCNGSSTAGGRKAATGAPSFCRAARLNS